MMKFNDDARKSVSNMKFYGSHWSHRWILVSAMCASLLSFSQANAGWVVEAFLDEGFTSSFVVDPDESDPDGWSFSLLREGVYADSGIGQIPITYTFQTALTPGLFDSYKSGPDVSAGGRIENDDIPNGLSDHAEAYVVGSILPGHAYGAGWTYEFELIIEAGKTITFVLDGGSLFASANDPGDDGFAFASIKLFSIDVDGNDPGGANNPYAQSSVFAGAGQSNSSNAMFSYSFINETTESAAYLLWLEGSALVFQSGQIVPEASSLCLLALGGLLLIPRRLNG